MTYKVPFVNFPLHYSHLESEIDSAIKGVLLGGDYIMRQQLRDFENNLAAFIGVDYTVGLNSGTDALHLSLLAAGVGPGDEVGSNGDGIIGNTSDALDTNQGDETGHQSFLGHLLIGGQTQVGAF